MTEAKERVLRLMRHDFGFDEQHALGQALKEFPDVNPDYLKAVICFD